MDRCRYMPMLYPCGVGNFSNASNASNTSDDSSNYINTEMQDLSSVDDETCCICYIKIDEDTPYAKVDNDDHHKYHINCLEQWVHKTGKCITTDEDIKSYSVYQYNSLIETINCKEDTNVTEVDIPTEDLDSLQQNSTTINNIINTNNVNTTTTTNASVTSVTHVCSMKKIIGVTAFVCICVMVYYIISKTTTLFG